MSLLRELPRYSDNKLAGIEIHALKIKHVIDNPRGFELHFEDERFAPHQVSNDWMTQHAAECGGYIAFESDGNGSYWEAEAFESVFEAVT